jgi:hypothetical protein
MPPQPRLVRQHALEYDSLEPPAPRTANEIEDERIWIEQQQRNTRNLHNVLSDMRPARNIDNVMSDRNRNGGKTRARKNRRTRARRNRRTRARKNRRTRARR